MRKKLLVLLALLVPFMMVFGGDTKVDMQNEYLAFLKAEGFSGKIDGDGDVEFKFEGKFYYFIIDETDPEFFYILFPNFWAIESAEERAQVASAASIASKTTKVAKVYIDGNDTSIGAQVFIKDKDDYKIWFRRMIDCIGTALDAFREEMDRGE